MSNIRAREDFPRHTENISSSTKRLTNALLARNKGRIGRARIKHLLTGKMVECNIEGVDCIGNVVGLTSNKYWGSDAIILLVEITCYKDVNNGYTKAFPRRKQRHCCLLRPYTTKYGSIMREGFTPDGGSTFCIVELSPYMEDDVAFVGCSFGISEWARKIMCLPVEYIPYLYKYIYENKSGKNLHGSVASIQQILDIHGHESCASVYNILNLQDSCVDPLAPEQEELIPKEFSYSEVEAFNAAEAQIKREEALGNVIPRLARKYGDDVNSPNMCIGDPYYNLAKESRAPLCDCQKPMHLHSYILGTNSAKNQILKIPNWEMHSDCQMCFGSITGPRWVCPDISCKMCDSYGTKRDKVLQICTKCVDIHGIITCMVCGDEVKKWYSLPCKTCSTPLCWQCHAEWTEKCHKMHNQVNCPFCRSEIDEMTLSHGENRRSGSKIDWSRYL